eukprot:403942-Hanusia_phi.AAC.3
MVATIERNANVEPVPKDTPASVKLPLSCFRKLGLAMSTEELKAICTKRSRIKEESQESSDTDTFNFRKGSKVSSISIEKKDEGWMLEDVGLRPVSYVPVQ